MPHDECDGNPGAKFVGSRQETATPRTDEQVAIINAASGLYWVKAEFARSLEHELSAAKAQLAEECRFHTDIIEAEFATARVDGFNQGKEAAGTLCNATFKYLTENASGEDADFYLEELGNLAAAIRALEHKP